jgi:disulfide bond formation protein DsbB
MWLRVAALLCVLFVGVAGIAQAAHIHGEWLPGSATQVAAHSALSPTLGEDACPLCVAMHSALPVTGFAVLMVALLLECNLLLASTHKPRMLWYFAAFSRPPPSLR